LINRTGPYRVISYTEPTVTTQFELRIFNLTQHAGCANVQVRAWGQAPNHLYSGGDDFVSACAVLATSHPADHIAVRVVPTSGSVPHWAIYDGDGTLACESSQAFAECALTHAGPVVLVISDAAGGSGKYTFYDEQYGTAGCTSAGTLGFDAPRLTGSIGAAGEMDCLSGITSSSLYQRLRLAFGTAAQGLRAHAYLVDPSGYSFCSFDSTPPTQPTGCFVGADTYRLLVYGSGATTGLYRLHVWQLVDPVGCTSLGPLPGGWTDPLTGGLLDATDEDCYTFTVPRAQSPLSAHAESTDPTDPSVLLQVVRTSDASVRCASSTGVLANCYLPSRVTYALIVGDSDPTHPMAGTYTVTRGQPS
jgi:hypothetical protein